VFDLTLALRWVEVSMKKTIGISMFPHFGTYFPDPCLRIKKVDPNVSLHGGDAESEYPEDFQLGDRVMTIERRD
jgi:hypothetical protein